MKRELSAVVPALALVMTLAQPLASTAVAQSVVPAPGSVIALQGTDHLWGVDNQGRTYFIGDERALARVDLDWNQRADLTRSELGSMSQADPVLTAALVRIGDAVYLPEFSAAGARPTLLLIQCPADLSLLGVDADNYDQLVLDRATWEQRYGYRTDQLAYDDFRVDPTPPVGPAMPLPSTCDDISGSR